MAEPCGYCRKVETAWNSIISYTCDECGANVHYDCITSKQPSPLLGDILFKFKCQSCGEDNQEEFHRLKLPWRNAVMLALYNLHKTGVGRCGFFHWKAHICSFISTHWLNLFGHEKKKTGLWTGTVAGALSAGCPEFFESGMNVVEQGYWRLVKVEPPLILHERKYNRTSKRKPEPSPVELQSSAARACRSNKPNSLLAAIELKEKREGITKIGRKRDKTSKGNTKKSEDVSTVSQTEGELQECEDSMSSVGSSFQDGDITPKMECEEILDTSSMTSEIYVTTLSSNRVEEVVRSRGKSSKLSFQSLGLSLGNGEDDESDLDIDVDIESVAINSDHLVDIRAMSPELTTLIPPEDIKWEQASIPELESLVGDIESEGESERDIKEEVVEDEVGDEENNEINDKDDNNDTDSTDESSEDEQRNEDRDVDDKKKKQGRPRKRRRLDDPPPIASPERLQHISVFEENELLKRLDVSAQNNTLTPEFALLRRKLICNQTNREYGLPVFDLDAQVEKALKSHKVDNATNAHQDYVSVMSRVSVRPAKNKETRDLDRFMMKDSGKRKETRVYTSFRQRLVGLEDNDLRPVVSPYTTRVLVPFIWRNKNVSQVPLKMKLLQEIQGYLHRDDPTWSPPPPPSIDFCYVRPEHIASVNALAREFFWPGIDMSECLQYPDFSCVVLYRKIVIAFAFMVPDRGYNEAYISFIFTHPEWRGVGIASFMLYHLIQTCMGKDVLLHVSASNPAMLLYQKFGFKAEELSLNFYYKYFPSHCTDSCHAFLMRLSR